MLQLSLIEENDRPELADLVARIKEARGGRYIQPYKLLLHSPDIAAAWLDLVTAVRWKTTLDDQTRELVILRTAILTRVNYVKREHENIYAPRAGLTRAHFEALANWRDSKLFSSAQRAALAYTDAMTSDIQVADEIGRELQQHYDERQVIELTVLIGTYNMHTRVLQALDLESRSANDK